MTWPFTYVDSPQGPQTCPTCHFSLCSTWIRAHSTESWENGLEKQREASLSPKTTRATEKELLEAQKQREALKAIPSWQAEQSRRRTITEAAGKHHSLSCPHCLLLTQKTQRWAAKCPRSLGALWETEPDSPPLPQDTMITQTNGPL